MPYCLPFGRFKQWEKCYFFKRFLKSCSLISLLFHIYFLWESSRSCLSHWWRSLRFSNPLHGKNTLILSLLISNFFTSVGNAQHDLYCLNLSQIDTQFIHGDIEFFKFEDPIVTDFHNEKGGTFSLNIKNPKPEQLHLLELQCRFDINTSSKNNIRYQITDSANNLYSVQIGNTKDRIEFWVNDSLIAHGNDDDFNVNQTSLIIDFHLLNQQLNVVISNLNDTLKWNFNNTAYGYIKAFRMRVNQYGKTAIGAHSIEKVCWRKKPIDVKIQQMELLEQNRILLTTTASINLPEKDSVKINNKNINHLHFGHTSNQILIGFAPPKNDSFLELYIPLERFGFHQVNTQQTRIPYRFKHPPQWGDLIISEILFDVTPRYRNTPAVEFIELYNCSDRLINLENSSWLINEKAWVLPKCEINPKQAIVFSKPVNVGWDTLPGIKSRDFPNLLSTANSIELYGPENKLLDHVICNKDQQKQEFRDGGTSLHRDINGGPFAPRNHWFTSINTCSPHKINLPNEPNLPLIAFGAYRFYDSIIIQLNSELQHHQTIQYAEKGPFYHALYTRGKSIRIPNGNQIRDSLLLVLTNRSLDTDTLSVPISDIGQSSLVVSEILFEHDKNIDFVEIHNQGINALFLEDLDLLIYDNNKLLDQIIPLNNQNRKVIFPNETLVLTSNESDLFYHYPQINRNLVVQVPRFPNLKSTGGEIEIVHHLYGRIEKVPFNRDLHSQTKTKNISLERACFQVHARQDQVWYSHLPLERESSPTTIPKWVNRNTYHHFIQLNRRVIINPMEEKISFHYDLKNPFNFLTAKLFTAWGKPLYQILEPVQVSNEGQMNIPLIKNNHLLPSGNYILKFEIANPKTLQKSTQVERITIKYP